MMYDLGSGVGKAMVAAALSGICFSKIVGIEVLPSLLQCSRDLLTELTSQVNTNAMVIPSSSGPSHGVNNPLNSQLNPLGISEVIKDGNSTFIIDDLSVVSSNTYSYHVPTLTDLKERLKKAKITLPLLETRNENFLQSNLADADIVYMNCPCFGDDPLNKICKELCRQLKEGSRWITAKLPDRKALYESYFHVDETGSETRDRCCHTSSGRMEFYVLVRNERVFKTADDDEEERVWDN